MKQYDFTRRNAHWQKEWEKAKLYEAEAGTDKKKYYCLIEFPYPSGDGLHVGHVRPYIGLDIIARKRRAEGYNVLFPIGWDAFGLPTENYALKTGIHPREVTKQNTDNFRRQIKSLGTSFDWSREINTSDPSYYKWTQWIFLRMFHEGLAYKATIPINWCLSCKIGLANEEVVNGKCERCGGETEKREREQWLLAITQYADRLEKGLNTVDYLEQIKVQQKNWIGKSKGAIIKFKLQNVNGKRDNDVQCVEVFTTRPDTLFGATYLVIAPEHHIISKIKHRIVNIKEVERYIKNAKEKSDIERTAEGGEKTGVELKGVTALNPANKQEIPIWISDYVLAHYGTGCIMAVPAHDTRDYAFAKKFNLPITEVISGGDIQKEAYTGEGALIHSGRFNGLDSAAARREITKAVNGTERVVYKLRDWVFSRQRYWGEPIPLVFCEHCAQKISTAQGTHKEYSKGELRNPGWIALQEDDLPVTLPDIKEYRPTTTGESPLANVDRWVHTTCPKCKGTAKRETDVMPNWAGSSWYFLRYIDPENHKALASRQSLQYWMPVDWYNGGMEHTTLHLLYSRFWHYFLYDIGVVPQEEPYAKRTSHGMVLAEGGEKMSKSKGNVINPDDIVRRYGADTLRLYEMFMGPFDQAIAWNSDDIIGVRRFLDKVYDYITQWIVLQKRYPGASGDKRFKPVIHQTIEKVSSDIEVMRFNTAVAAMMKCVNVLREESLDSKTGTVTGVAYQFPDREDIQALLIVLSPFAPHIAEELWRLLGEQDSIHRQPWPQADPRYLRMEEVTIVIQVNGRVRGKIVAGAGLSKDDVFARAQGEANVAKWLQNKEIAKVIYVPDRLLNVVTKQ